MKRYYTILAFLLACLMTSAKTLVITLSDNSKVYYSLGEPSADNVFAPVVVFDKGTVIVKGDRYEFSGIREFRLSDESSPAGIESETLRFDSPAVVSIYTMDGKKVVDAEHVGSVRQIDTSRLPKGIFVVKVKYVSENHEEVSFKFTKK